MRPLTVNNFSKYPSDLSIKFQYYSYLINCYFQLTMFWLSAMFDAYVCIYICLCEVWFEVQSSVVKMGLTCLKTWDLSKLHNNFFLKNLAGSFKNKVIHEKKMKYINRILKKQFYRKQYSKRRLCILQMSHQKLTKC